MKGATQGTVAWWVREPRGCGTVSQDGVWTAPAVVPEPPVCHVVATSFDGARSAEVSIEVGPAAGLGRTRPASRKGVVDPPPPRFPLRVSGDGRYLEDQDARPFRVQADAAWFLSTNATPEEVEAYLALRQAQGFDAFYLMAMVHPGAYTDIPHAPANAAGLLPFTTPGGLGAPSEPYWRWIDFVVDRAAERGIAVMLAYTYLGYDGGDQGWYQEVLAQPGRDSCFEWGRWLGRRYKERSNVVWFALGDYTPPPGSEGALRVKRIAEGIKAAGARQLFMAELSSPDSLPSDAADFAGLIDQNSFYGYGPGANGLVYETAARAWDVVPPRPAWQQEGIYEQDPNVPAFTGAAWETRRARYWSVLAGGIAGDGFGSRDAYKWVRFPASLFSPGAEYSTVAFRLFATLPWWRLRPSGTGHGRAGRDLVVSGGGTPGRPDFVTAAVVEGGSHLVAYVPPTGAAPRTLTIDLSALSAPARARWYNPASGAWTEIATRLPNAGTREFVTPGDNGTGLGDWVLVLDPATFAPVPMAATVPRGGPP